MIVPQIIPLVSKIMASGLYELVFLPCLAIGLVVGIWHLLKHILTGRD